MYFGGWREVCGLVFVGLVSLIDHGCLMGFGLLASWRWGVSVLACVFSKVFKGISFAVRLLFVA